MALWLNSLCILVELRLRLLVAALPVTTLSNVCSGGTVNLTALLLKHDRVIW